MHTNPTQSSRARLCLKWSQQADAYLGDDPESEVDAIWFPPTRPENEDPLALLHCERVHADTRRIQVRALRPGRREPDHLLLPMDHVLPLSCSSLPPLSFASVASAEPFFDELGESEAYRIRCLAQVPPHVPISPLQVARSIPGMRVVATKTAVPGRCDCGFRWTPEGMRLEVEQSPVTGEPTESSVGMALAAWFCSRLPKGTIDLSWNRKKREKSLDFLSERTIATYQALRLPALALFMVARATAARESAPGSLIKEILGVPYDLINDRYEALRLTRKA